jgi:hypothetical protein
MGRNYSNDPNNPNIVTDTSAIPVTTIYHFYRNGSGAFTTTINGAIVPGSLDDGTGTLDTVTPAKYTIQRIFYLPDQPTLLGVYYGRQEYNSITDAQANIPFEEFSESESTATQGIFCGWLIVQGNATALNDTTKAKFVNAGLFRNTANIGGGGLAIASIDDLNDVTTTTPTNNQVLRWNSGTAQWVNSDISSLAVSSFNGLTGAVTGVTTSIANTFTALNSFNAGISASALTVSGRISSTGGVTFGSGTTFMAFVPNTAANNGGLWVRDGVLQVGGTVLSQGLGNLNYSQNTEHLYVYGYQIIENSAVYQGTRTGLTVKGGTAQNVPLFNVTRGGTSTLQVDQNGIVVAALGLSGSGGATFSGTFSGTTGAFSKQLTASAGVLTDSVVPLLGAGSAGTLYINANAGGGGGGSITNIGDWTTDSSGTYIIVDDTNEAVTISAAAAINLNSLVNISGTGTFGSTVTVSSGGAVLEWDGLGAAPIVFTVANTDTSANNILFNAAGGATFAADIAINGVRVGRGGGSVATNTVLGAGAGTAGTTGANNIFLGSAAGDAVTIGSRNIAIGTDALGAGVTTSDCIAVGHNALLLNKGDNNISIGKFTLDALTTGINNAAIGSDAASAITTGSNNFAFGTNALKVATTVSDNVAIGKDALQAKSTSGNGNVAIGTSAMYRATTALTCTAVGYQSQFGNAAGTGQGNSSLGYNSMVSVISGTYNSAFGINALYGLTSGSQNTACGLESLYAITSTNSNTGVGTAALRNITNGAQNTGIGHSAGRYKTASNVDHTLSGDSNIYIGYQSRASGDSVTKEVVIGSIDALGLGSNTTVIGTSTTLGNRIFGVASTGQVAPTIASAATIAPTTSIVFISGTAAVATITAPSTIATTGGQITLIPTGLFTTTAAGNIALASTAVVSKALTMTYDATTTKWYPSY